MRLLAITALVLSGAVQACIAPPLEWVALHLVSWVPALLVLARLRGRRAFAAGWLVGFSAQAAIFAWIVHTVGVFSNLPRPAAVAVWLLFAAATGLYAGVFALGLAPLRRACGALWPLGAAAWFTACESFFPQLFPYQQGVAWYRHPDVFLVSALTGIAGVSFGVILINAVVCQALEAVGARASLRATGGNAAVAALLAAGAFAGSQQRLAAIERAEAATSPLRVAVVQPDPDPATRRAERRDHPERVSGDLLALSADALARDPDIEVFVWPERALVWTPSHRWNQAVPRFARERGVEVWAGGGAAGTAADGRRVQFNSAFRIDASGAVAPRYDKNVLLPFGEFVPFEGVFPVLRRLQGPGRLAAGHERPIYATARARFVFLICYEAILPAAVRRAVADGADLLVNLTYDGWFGPTAEPWQHLMLAAAQAAQFGVPLVRSTTTGVSAFVDARGQVAAQLGLGARGVLVRDVRPVRLPGLYAEWGDWFARGCAVASLALVAAGARPTLRSRA
ncbi:MAG: apolipoprotein N-acyltransferase [Myxococcota bacterium]|nr:apolipoprotein N-acyltransferase [Myxococcota bacterium]